MTTLTKTKLMLVGFTSLAFMACSTTGNVERNAGAGAAIGAAVGAGIGAISGDVGVTEGAAIGAGVGGAAGAYKGYRDDQAQGTPTSMAPNLDRSTRYFDEPTGRYYFYEQGTNRTYFENGELRG